MKFDYGDEVILRNRAADGTDTEKACQVVGITPIETEKQATVFKYPLGLFCIPSSSETVPMSWFLKAICEPQTEGG